MIDTLRLLIFTPTYPGGLRSQTIASVVNQQTSHWLTWEIGRRNPYPIGDMGNVLAQFTYAREVCLRGPYDALLTVEHDMVLPPNAVEKLTNTPAPVVYGTYLLRHGPPTLNAWRYEGPQGMGMSLDRYQGELAAFRAAGVGRVSGVGFGCTLIRRHVLEMVPFRADGNGHAPDIPFAFDCNRLGITQLARFDVKCGHIHEGDLLAIDDYTPTVKVKVKQSVNILINGGGVALVEGQEMELETKQAKDLAALGLVDLVTEPTAPHPEGSRPRRKKVGA